MQEEKKALLLGREQQVARLMMHDRLASGCAWSRQGMDGMALRPRGRSTGSLSTAKPLTAQVTGPPGTMRRLLRAYGGDQAHCARGTANTRHKGDFATSPAASRSVGQGCAMPCRDGEPRGACFFVGGRRDQTRRDETEPDQTRQTRQTIHGRRSGTQPANDKLLLLAARQRRPPTSCRRHGASEGA